MKKFPLILMMGLLCCLNPGIVMAVTVQASVAASLAEAFKELSAAFTATHPEVEVVANFGASGALAKQVVQGAPVDIFISANAQWMDYLVARQRVVAGTVQTLAGNTLVFVGKQDLPVATLADVANLRSIAIGSPKSVPAGQYAEQALKAAGLYDALQGKLVMAQDVRQALVYADRGETDGAFVYRTDALLARESVVLLEVPQNLYDEATYPLGLTVEGAAKPETLAFRDFLKTDTAGAILQKYGFVVK